MAGRVDGERVSLFVLGEMGRTQHSFAGFTGYHGVATLLGAVEGQGGGKGCVCL